MRLVVTNCLFFLLSLPALCQIHITTAETWQDDTVKVVQNIIIDEGATLTINPGTVVLFVDRNFIDVYGALNINGAESDSVVMTAIDTTWAPYDSRKLFYGWGGIFAYNHGSVKATYAVFEKLGFSHHSKNGNAVFGALRNESNNAMEFEHCRFAFKRDAQQTGEGSAIQGSHAAIIIKSSVFRNNKGGGTLINIDNDGSLLISNTTFSNNNMVGSMIHAPDAFYNINTSHFENNKVKALIAAGTYTGTSSVERNIFINNQGAFELKGIYSDIYFRNNIYENNGGQIYFEHGKNVITGNVFQDNYYADPYNFFGNDYEGIIRIEYTGESAVMVANNSFINNRAIALRMWSTNTFSIENNIFHNNYPMNISLSTTPEYLNDNGRSFKYNILKEPIPGTGNRTGNPRLAEPDGFLLAANSPAIDNGTLTHSDYLLSTDVMGNPRIKGEIDIGAVEFSSDYVPLTGITISDTVVTAMNANAEVAHFATNNKFDPDVVTYILSDENGMNDDYFSIDGDKLILKKDLTTESILRIKVRAEHISGAWVEGYYYLTVTQTITEAEHPKSSTPRVYPIPTNQLLYVNDIVPGTTYSIFSISGVEIQSNSSLDGIINVSELADGVYILQLSYGRNMERVKFFKSTR